MALDQNIFELPIFEVKKIGWEIAAKSYKLLR